MQTAAGRAGGQGGAVMVGAAADAWVAGSDRPEKETVGALVLFR